MPKEIKKAVLTAYINKCRELYHIAFFQWRLKFPNKLNFNPKILEELIEDRQNYSYLRFASKLKYHILSQTTMEKTIISKSDE